MVDKAGKGQKSHITSVNVNWETTSEWNLAITTKVEDAHGTHTSGLLQVHTIKDMCCAHRHDKNIQNNIFCNSKKKKTEHINSQSTGKHKNKLWYSPITESCTAKKMDPPELHMGFPDGSAGKESTCNAGDPSLIPGSGRSAGEGIGYLLQYSWAFLVAQLVKNSSAMWETWVQFLGWEDPLEKGKATQYSGLENSMDTVYGVAKSCTGLSDFHFQSYI